MQKVLVVGDVHAVAEELDDCESLLHYIIDICIGQDIGEVWFSGDQHHNHNVIDLKVVNWWMSAIYRMKNNGIDPVFLVGNHDQSSPGSGLHAMSIYEDIPLVTVVSLPTIRHGVLMIPYVHNEDSFRALCQQYANTPTVFCHQTFNGSVYENGIYAKDGFDPDAIPQELVISGHIHTGQRFGKVWYVGSPRWRTLSDANVIRSLWEIHIDDNGTVQESISYSTAEVCRQIIHREDTEEHPVELLLDPRHQWRIDILGTPEWCEARKTAFQIAGARVRTFPTQVSTKGMVRESDGIENAFQSFLKLYQPKNGTPLETLERMARERLKV